MLLALSVEDTRMNPLACASLYYDDEDNNSDQSLSLPTDTMSSREREPAWCSSSSSTLLNTDTTGTWKRDQGPGLKLFEQSMQATSWRGPDLMPTRLATARKNRTHSHDVMAPFEYRDRD